MTSPDPHSRPLLASPALWGLPALLLADSLFAFLAGGWRPFGTIETVLLAACAAWGAAAVLMFLPSIRGRLGVLWRELLLLAVVVVVIWPILEFAAGRAERALRPTAPFHTRGANVHYTFEPDPVYLPGIHGPAHFTTGADGVRAAAPPSEGQTRVLCIGGSTTECVYLDDAETWPALLSRLSGANAAGELWVGNVGISGFDTQDHLRFVLESPLLEGVAVLLVQPGLNDLWRFLAGEVEAMDYARFVDHVQSPRQTDSVDAAPYRPWWTRSRLIQLYHTLRQPPPPPEQQEGVGGGEYAIRRSKRAAATLTDELPPLDAGLAAYRARIEGIIAACRDRDVKIVFTTQAVVWREDLPPDAAARCWFGWLPDGRYLTLGALRRAIDQYNAALLDVCARAGVPCVDLSPLHGNPAWFYDDCHFTEAGAEQVAARVGPVLGAILEGAP